MPNKSSEDLNFNDSKEKYGFPARQVIEHLSPVSIFQHKADICTCGHAAPFHTLKMCKGSAGSKCLCTRFKKAFSVEDYRFFIQETTGGNDLHALRRGLRLYLEVWEKFPRFFDPTFCYSCKGIMDFYDEDFGVAHVHYQSRTIDYTKRGQSRIFHIKCLWLYFYHHATDSEVEIRGLSDDWVPKKSANTPDL